jgi:F-type H+-transporting ATPase subunit delta
MVEKATLARPYAKAIFELALRDNAFEEWSKMLMFLSIVVRDERVNQLLQNVTVKAAVLKDFFLNIGEETLNAYGRNLVQTLAERRRFALLPEIAAAYEQKREENENILTAKCVSKIPLTKVQSEKLTNSLQEYFGRTMKMHYHIDPSLTGGYLIQAGDTVIDGTVSGQLMKLKEIMGG